MAHLRIAQDLFNAELTVSYGSYGLGPAVHLGTHLIGLLDIRE